VIARRPSQSPLTCSLPRRFQPLQLTSRPTNQAGNTFTPRSHYAGHSRRLRRRSWASSKSSLTPRSAPPRIAVSLLTTASHDGRDDMPASGEDRPCPNRACITEGGCHLQGLAKPRIAGMEGRFSRSLKLDPGHREQRGGPVRNFPELCWLHGRDVVTAR
jgi:hypothetical protein